MNPNTENSQFPVKKILYNTLLPAANACQPLLSLISKNGCLNTPTYHYSTHPYNLLDRQAGRQADRRISTSQQARKS